MQPIKLGRVHVARHPLFDAELTQVLRGGPFSAALHLAIEANGLPERSLVTLLGPRRPRGRWLDHPVAGVPVRRLWPHSEDLARLYTGLSDTPTDHLTRLSVSDDYYIGADRCAYRLVTRLVVRAEADRVARCLVVLWTEQRAGPRHATVTGTRYCRPGRIRESTGYTVAELVLDRVLRRGECAVLEYEMTIPKSVDGADEFARRFTAPTRQYALSAVFDPDTLPARCYGYQRLAVDGPDRCVEELRPAGNTVQTVAIDFLPGIVGLRWDWA
ncbi:MAG TPA: hypothetical protein VFZ32_15810 [Micromonosporaceae bacterium]